MKFFVGLDLGQSADYSALIVAERVPAEPKHGYHVRYVHRFPLGTSYPDVVERVKVLTLTPPLPGEAVLAVDATGVGAPVIDMLRAARLAVPLYAVFIHGGDQVTHQGRCWRVP